MPSEVEPMSSPETPEVIFYRFEDHPSLSDQHQQVIALRRFRLVRLSASGKTGWLQPEGSLSGEKRFRLDSRHPWAADDIGHAWALFRHRKRWQVALLRDQLQRAETALAVVEGSPPPVSGRHPLVVDLPLPLAP